MTTNTFYLHDQLSKRIARGRATADDLRLLNQLLVCLQRRALALGAATGASVALLVYTVGMTL